MLKNAISWKNYRGPIDNGSLYYNFRVLSKNNIFKKYYIYTINRYYTSGIYDKLKYTLTDTTFIPNCYGVEDIGKNKQYKNKKGNKISPLQGSFAPFGVISDSKGVPISVVIGAGNDHDSKLLIKNLNNLYINTKSYLLKNIIDTNNFY